MDEITFLDHLRGIQGYIMGMKMAEPGFIYDNLAEFEYLVKIMLELRPEKAEIIKIMSFLQSEIERAQERLEHPIRTPEEEAFYRNIVGINSYIRESKQKNPNWIFNNIGQVEGLLNELQSLNSQDPDILAIMDIITRDIKMIYMQIYSEDEANEFQERLSSLSINTKTEEIKR